MPRPFSRRHRTRFLRKCLPATRMEALEQRAYFTITFTTGSIVDLPTHTNAYERPLFGDFDGDGKTDVIVSSRSPAQGGPAGPLYFLKGKGDSDFEDPVLAAQAIFNYEPAAGDFNGDGKLDLIVTDFGADQLHVLPGNGNGTFATAQDFAVGDGPTNVVVADFNNDGLDDVVTDNRGTTAQGNSLTVRLGNAATLLSASTTVATDEDPASVTVGDFNGDGNVDLAAGNLAAQTIQLFPGAGNGSFGAGVSTTTAQAVVITAADFDKDGKLDIFRGIDNAGVPSVLFGNGDLTFRAITSEPAQTNLSSVVDFDLDGNLDLLETGVDSSGNGFVIPGNGDGTFGAPASYAFGAKSGSFGAAGDLTGDGVPDAAYVGGGSTPAIVTAIATPPPTANLVPTVTSTLPASVVGGDAGKATIRITNSGNGTFSGTVDLRLVASSDASVDSGDTEILTKSLKLNLKAGKGKSFKVKFDFPENLATGSYSVLAQVDPAGTAAQSPKTDDVAVAGPVTIAAPFVDLSTAFPSALSSKGYKIGKKSKVNVRLTNLGNIVAAGTATISLYSSTDTALDIGDTLVGTVDVKVKLKPQGGKTFKVVVNLPTGFAAGSTNLIASTASTDLNDTLNTNDVAVAAQPFVAIL